MITKPINQPARLLMPLLWILGLLMIGWFAPPTTASPTAEATPNATPDKYWPTQGWRTSTPEEQGMDSQKLAQVVDAVQEQKLDLYSFLVIRNGYIVSENYWSSRQETKREIYSCTKSFTSTLVGIAIDKGYIDGVNHGVLDFFSGRGFENQDALKARMTLDDLLTMRSGLDWQENDTAYRKLYQSADWVKFVMDEPMKEPPGGQFLYCTGCSHVISAIVQQTTGMSSGAFAQKNLFEPLGMSDVIWMADPSGIANGGWGLQITSRDMAKLGYLYLQNGNWDGQQIVSAGWVKTATQKHTSTDDSKLDYGYQWWLYPALDAYTALGRFGQTIFVIPKHNLIIVTTAYIENHDPIFELIEKYVVPAVQTS